MRRLTHWIILVAFIFSCGGQWAAFQVIAWGNMIREYSEMVPLAQAVQMTFSGQYPCAICKAIAERKSTEQQKEIVFAKYDKKYPLPVVVALAPPRIGDIVYLEPAFVFSSRVETPPTPPPRDALS
ncbi:MAG TPA: hypothetical protein VHY09_11110 [Candidatus Methylacidiphilales bacterium]|jgi:hypothetical protein|nr:hypothetical protein [Candidatus Methylacidiphilales bacterium]